MTSRKALVCVAVAVLALAPVPALAHTSLASSTPADRSTLAVPPRTVELVFANAVEPRLVRVYVLSSDGGRRGTGRRTTADSPPTQVVEFSLPRLADGVYGLEWESLGTDGHRVAGEIVVSIGRGDVATARAATATIAGRHAQGSNPWTTIPAGIGRFMWYVGLSLSVGALFALWVSGDHSAGPSPAGTIARFAARALGWGLWVALSGVALRWLAAIAVFAGYATGREPPARSMDALTSPGATAGAVGLLALAWAVRASASLRSGVWAAPAAASVGLGLVVTALALATTGHGASDSTLGVMLGAGHVLAAAAWVGPVVVAGMAVTSKTWRLHNTEERGSVLRVYFGRFASVALWSFAVLVLSGVRAAWVNVGPRLHWNEYGLALTVKLVVLAAVILPVGLYHDRLVRGRSAAARLLGSAVQRTIRIEAVALVAILVAASALTGLNPKSRPASAEPGTGRKSTTVGDVAVCARKAVGGPRCYRDYFAGLMMKKGAAAALAKIEALSMTDQWVRTQCHQVVHDLGNDAAIYYGSLAKALAVEGSVCASGYYHGVVEETLAETPDNKLRDEAPSVCAEVAARRYSAPHFSCLHGLGHGLMLRLSSDLWQALPLCEAFTDSWERVSCSGGVFMENIVSAQQGSKTAVLRDDDPLYPCDAVAREHKGQCYRLQTSYILWRNGRNYAEGFATCDRAERSFVDDCYQSMGRDISGDGLLDPNFVVEKCNLGREEMRVNCITAAAQNAVYTDRNARKATELCGMVDPRYRKPCLEARDQVMASFRKA